MTILHICRETGKGAAYFAQAVYEVVSTTDGLSRLASLVFPIFELLGKLYQVVPTAITILDKAFGSFSDLTILYILAKRLKSFFVPDAETGKFLWETAWQNVVSTLCAFVSNVMRLLSYLKTLSLVTLGNAADPILLVGAVASTASNAFDTWNTINSIRRSSLHQRKAVHLKGEWNHFHSTLLKEDQTRISKEWEKWAEHVKEKIEQYDHRIEALKRPDLTPEELIKLQRAERKKNQWEVLSRCEDNAKIITFCQEKARKWSAVSANCKIDQTKSWISIAINIANIVITVLGFLLPKEINAFQIPLIGLTIATNTLDLSSVLVDKFLPAIHVHEPLLP